MNGGHIKIQMEDGIPLRLWVATMALQGLLINKPDNCHALAEVRKVSQATVLADLSLQYADALIEKARGT